MRLATSLLIFPVLLCACPPSGDPKTAHRTPMAEQWLQRAQASYRNGDFDDATEASKQALVLAPRDTEVRVQAARIALTRLDFAEVIKWTEGIQTTEAHGLRGRAFWYNGDIENAADELEALLQDPKVKDPWARDVSRLARRGAGRHPFQIEGGIVAAVEMPVVVGDVPLGPAHLVPCEVEGERVLALVATAVSEVVIDSNARREPAWVNLRFGDRVEVRDVPALTQDLSPISRHIGVPIKALLGVNLLRHAHATFDRRGAQFIVRRNDASAPPDASRVPLHYLRGGGMTLRASVNTRGDGDSTLLVDSTRFISVALSDETWKRAGTDIKTLAPVQDAPNVRRGPVPTFRLGGFDLARMPALSGFDFSELQQAVDVDLAGLVGAELLSFFRITFADEGRFIWIEPDPTLIAPPTAQRPPPPADVPPPSSDPSRPRLAPPGPLAPPRATPPRRGP